MKNLIFIGSGGFFRELYEYCVLDIQNKKLKNIYLKGVLDDNEAANSAGLAHLGSVANYIIQKDDAFIIAIGNPQIRLKLFNQLSAKGANFFSYIHSSCYISPSSQIADGVIICPNSIVNANAIVGSNVAINVFCSIGHDSQINAHSVLSPYCAVNGGAQIGSGCFLGTRATIFPLVIVKNKASVDAHVSVRSTLDEKQILFVKNQYKTVKNRLLG